ncbi:hypothetical protein G7072_03725 [Nocardioides sp. HDW12B]|uniref:hypothetical protein n=1 Tax=Nocardioides sp. HDW12B TaxID=2714939 RepID=UPI00140CD3C3|nr:hypothetical protein [Nocardioides sp. HDW12B]QIK65564.1 hypothetical protein G7072_03725 [Nocardioides sp. HDW12B]
MSRPVDTPAPRVVLHVGAPKSGTTYLQRVLWRNRDELAGVGLTCPGSQQRAMFEAAVEVRGVAERWGMDPDGIAGTWARLCAEARAHPGTTVMSHEVLAAASAEQAATAMAELEGLEVHVVFTAREVSRQLVSEWQENVKNGSGQSFERFSRLVMKDASRSEHLFWRYQNVLGVLDRWGAGVPPERLHVVVAPVGGGDVTVLWRRFAEACGLDPDVVANPVVSQSANQTLGMTQVRLLRRVVTSLDGRLQQPDYARVVKRLFAQRVLAGQSSDRPTCPPALYDPLTELSRSWIGGVRERGYRVHGDLDELLPVAPPADARAPDAVPAEEEIALAADAIAELLLEVSHRPPPRKKAERADGAAPRPGPGVVPPAPRGRSLVRRTASRLRRLARRR